MLHVVCKRIKCIYTLLYKVSHSSSDSSDRIVDARGLISQFNIIKLIFALQTVFQLSNATSDLLQSPQLDYSEALTLLDCLKDDLMKMRRKSSLEAMRDKAASLCQEMGLGEEKKKDVKSCPYF
ncbi:hypothetical protein AVEN_111152-1 [Araneus ventricosus]|uniref:Uncharacterized protein n=1 Tax=Araneus ventricosus TaxID=182803 RepID=A0A4Y2V167_ARAVE|nr:hypothetical protein AVEN_111152-1 [Araneus ventricosus]